MFKWFNDRSRFSVWPRRRTTVTLNRVCMFRLQCRVSTRSETSRTSHIISFLFHSHTPIPLRMRSHFTPAAGRFSIPLQFCVLVSLAPSVRTLSIFLSFSGPVSRCESKVHRLLNRPPGLWILLLILAVWTGFRFSLRFYYTAQEQIFNLFFNLEKQLDYRLYYLVRVR